MSSVNTLLAVKDLMNPDIVKASSNVKVIDAARMIAEHKVSSVVITDDEGKIAGIVTENDIVTKVVAQALDPATAPVVDIMSHDIHHIPGESSIFDARARMVKLGVKHLIVEVGGKPVGLISSTSLLGGA
ncbi:MAG: CBS domain-containing protein [Nitrospinota bacterium]|nr:CBS domain-containing protein [Nitrospinota bacterium]